MSIKAEQRASRYARRVLVDGRLVAPAEAPHGKYSTYANWGCQCEPCASAWRGAVHRRRVARRATLTRDGIGRLVATEPGVQHGTHSTYTNWGCKCRPCLDAHAAYARGRRSRQSVAS